MKREGLRPSELEEEECRLGKLLLAADAAGAAPLLFVVAVLAAGALTAGGRSACMNLKLRTLYQRSDVLRELKSARLTWAQP